MRSLYRHTLTVIIASALLLLMYKSASHDLEHHDDHHPRQGCVLCLHGSPAAEEALSFTITSVDVFTVDHLEQVRRSPSDRTNILPPFRAPPITA